MNSASWKFSVADVCGYSGVPSHAALIHKNSGTEAALTELLRDHVHDYGSSCGQGRWPPSKQAGCPSPRNWKMSWRRSPLAAVRMRMGGERFDVDTSFPHFLRCGVLW